MQFINYAILLETLKLNRGTELWNLADKIKLFAIDFSRKFG